MKCLFCGKKEADVEKIVIVDSVFVNTKPKTIMVGPVEIQLTMKRPVGLCNECIETCHKLIKEE